MSEAPAATPVRYDLSGVTALITIDRPERRNAINPEVTQAVSESLQRAERDGARVAVLTGAGDKAFCAGGDLGQMSADGPVAQHFVRGEIGRLFDQMRRSPLPIIARVNGHALAGGFGLMLACDLVIACDDAEMGLPEIDLGLWPFMVTALVHRDVPRKRALELMLTGDRIMAGEGEHLGFVNRVVPRGELDGAVDDLAARLASKSPLTTELGKRSFYRSEDQSFEQALDYLTGMLTLCLQSEDVAEGVSAFLQKRAPEWKGR